MPVTLPTFTVAEVSTAHITEEDGARLRDDYLFSRPSGSGHIVYVEDEFDITNYYERHYSLAFCNILRIALVQGVNYVRFDPDVTTGPSGLDLPTFDW